MERELPHNPAIAILSGPSGIGVIHALSLEDIPIITVDRTWPPTFGGLSCYSAQRIIYSPALGMTLEGTLQKLEKSFTGMGVLFPSNDEGLESLLTTTHDFPRRFHVPVASHIGFNIFDKNWQYTLAEQIGVPLPRNVRFTGGEFPDLQDLLFPLVVKPANRAGNSAKKIFRLCLLQDLAEAERLFVKMQDEHPGRAFQISENIPGEPDQLYTVGSYSNRAGKVLRSYTGRKITQYPYYHGGASIAESVAPPDGLVELAQALLNHASFHGISQVEFKFDIRDGTYKFLEINGRSWLWSKLAAFSGVNLAAMQYYDVTDNPRLEDLLARGQDSRFFYVHNMHITLNHIPSERSLISELCQSKTLIPSIEMEGEWRLKFIYSCIARFRRMILVIRSLITKQQQEATDTSS